MGTRKRPAIAITLSQEALDRLTELAESRGQSKSAAIESLIRNETGITRGDTPPAIRRS